MCGIVGFISGAGKRGFPQDRATYLKQGLVIDTLRGYDSTGVFTVDVDAQDKTAYWEKCAITGGEFVQGKDFYNMVATPSSLRSAIGHNRAATKGAIDTENAHPFQVGSVTMVHNGTLDSVRSLPHHPGNTKELKDVDVDSAVVAYNLDAANISEWYSQMFGSWALVWHDSDDQTMNIVRNEARPLHIAKVEREDTILIASEADMLAFLSRRCRIRLSGIYSLQAHSHFKWYPDSLINKPDITTLERAYSDYSYRDTYGKGYSYGHTSRRSGESSAPFVAGETNKVFMCGKTREVPAKHKALLKNSDLRVEDRLVFRPWEAYGENPTAPVWGWLEEESMPALVLGYPEYSRKSMGKHSAWVVRPVTILYPDGDAETDIADGGIVVCRYVQIRSTSTTQGAKKTYTQTAIGPQGSSISIAKFKELVADGCTNCKETISFLDDMDVSWLEGNKPVCPKCVDKMILDDEDNFFESVGDAF